MFCSIYDIIFHKSWSAIRRKLDDETAADYFLKMVFGEENIA